MDYSKMGGARPGSNKPKFKAEDLKREGKAGTGGKASKAELLARMKAQNESKKTD
ncbi:MULTISPECIES: hypothetical protein [unclassified Salipiger]|uniref:hypothetical protein n=1 Tax=unclassified Salipiger TaxID=2640570 RepID=UPI00187DB70B|nr:MULTISPECIES: hypothetical protein [unclassified Salipiger]